MKTMTNVLRAVTVRSTLLVSSLCFTGLAAEADVYFGYAPLDPDPNVLTAQGSGLNGYAEASITLDPAKNPVVAHLKGHKILGVRCYMRNDYPQKSKRTSAINVRTGSLDAAPEKNYVNLMKGWNDIMLENPVTIGDEPIYVGPMVYETSGNPYPFVSVPGGAIPGGYNISLGKGEWMQLSERGNLLCHVIVDAKPEEMPLAAQCALSDIPLVVAPESDFTCSLTFHNFSGREIKESEITVVTDAGASSYSRIVGFNPPLAAFDTRTITTQIPTGKQENPYVDYSISVSSIDGKDSDVRIPTDFSLHVTKDAFLRIPLVEEFTSQSCPNCPFMTYYLDMALEEFGEPYVYITRHTGFVDDKFTHPYDKELLYLFGEDLTFNPAVMYDRRVFSESDLTPVYGAKISSTTPYMEALRNVASRPALAKILVDSKVEDGKVSCRVYGRVADGVNLENLRLSASFIENGMTIDRYPQDGILDAPDDAPDDLVERFRHNGVVRVAFNKEPLGDLLEVDPETREFNVEYDLADVKSFWNLDNCEAVAFICRVNKDDMRENYVLNAGGTRWNNAVNGLSGVEHLEMTEPDVRVYIGDDGLLRVAGEHSSVYIYTVDGRSLDPRQTLTSGLYIVNVLTPTGHRTFKILH